MSQPWQQRLGIVPAETWLIDRLRGILTPADFEALRVDLAAHKRRYNRACALNSFERRIAMAGKHGSIFDLAKPRAALANPEAYVNGTEGDEG
jgi:hypothetical protein